MAGRVRIDYVLLKRLAEAELPPTDDFIRSDMSLSQVDALQGASAVFKKLEDLVSSTAEQLATEKFLACNAKCKEFVLEPRRLYDDILIETVKYNLERWLHPDGLPITAQTLFELGRLGVGANVGVKENNFYTKMFDSKLTSPNSQLYDIYRRSAASHPTWAQAEMARSARRGERVSDVGKLAFAPKQFNIKRTIISETVLGMFYQRGFGLAIDSCTEFWTGINLSDQPDLNREMARLGSLDGSFATIDLVSASDCKALTLCKAILPRYVNNWLERLRTKFVRRPDGQIEELHMVSSMGNGFTFSLQTIVFAAIVISCYEVLGIKPKRPRSFRPTETLVPEMEFRRRSIIGNYGVFGDDIVVRSDAYHYVCHALELFGYTVNVAKSFGAGDFRESCGADYWRGHLVRGVYIKNLRSTSDCYSAVNRLVKWSSRTGINVDLLVSYLASKVRFLPIPVGDGDTEGFKVPYSRSGITYYSLATRNLLYKALGERDEKWKLPDESGKYKQRDVYEGFVMNPSGILLCVLGGYIRDGQIPRTLHRGRVRRSKVLQRSVPFWDHVPQAASSKDELGDAWFSVAGGYIDRCFRGHSD